MSARPGKIVKSGHLRHIFFILPVFFICVTSSVADETSVSPDPVIKIVNSMSIEEKIGQLLMIGVPGTRIGTASKKLISAYRPGGLILFGYNYRTTEQLKQFNHSLQQHAVNSSSVPMFISIDQEGGRVRRITGTGITQFPGNMCAGSANDPLLTYRWGRILGMQLRMVGVNMNLAPDVDVNNNPDNPVINTRSFGSDPVLVSRHGDAYIKGLQGGGVMAVAKHYPGHGDTAQDSHKVLPVIPYNRKRLDAVELLPFRSAVSAGVSSIMTAHILYPEIEKNGMPATLSPIFLSSILRDEMKFNGLIMTDDMEMGAIAGNMKIGEAALVAVKAGADIILVTTHHNTKTIFNHLLNAVKEGTLSTERLNSSVERIIRSKIGFHIVNPNEPYSLMNVPAVERNYKDIATAEKVNRLISEKGLYFYRGAHERELSFSRKAHLFTDSSALKKLLASNPSLTVYPVSSLFTKLPSISRGDTVYVELRDSQATLAHRLKNHSEKNRNVIIISAENPFEITRYSGTVPVLFSFSNTNASYRAIADAVTGKIHVKDYSTINLGFGRGE